MKRIGMITIGQAPRTDVAPIVETHLAGRAELLQAGVLDGMTKQEVDEQLSPGPGEYVLTSRMADGEAVVMSREKIQPILQSKIESMENAGIQTILLLCTGVFPGLSAQHAFLIEPDHVIPPTVAAMVKGKRLGVLVPLAEQKEALKEKYHRYGLTPVFAAASPYVEDAESYREACAELKDQADIVLLDCMGYTEGARELVSELTGLPVILSNAIMAKLVSEMI
ncbi:AroM family protein [Brevibacillus ruminantium]|uniref:AroM family protein n=1 Tax=Brevibacillus ruminantium TaxID=2950604 RepID=A0ABY4WN05_9BACL|nr:AroM family protein [Brevibacillus ruminantium]USG68532.1 AroM family protein [Brevibacillus ruminantium]